MATKNKRNKMISIDEDIFNMLSNEDNASELINKLLMDYYHGESYTAEYDGEAE